MIWGEKDCARLAALVATGISYTLIGRKMHITKNAAIGKARRLKLTKSPSPSTPYQYKKSVFKPKPPKPAKRKIIQNKAIPPTPPPVPVSVPEMRLVTMMQLTSQHCRYPIDTPKELMFCGRIPDGQPPYCKAHAKICYMPLREPNRSERTLSIQAQLR